MLCYVMLCYVMLCYVMLCYVMLCYVMTNSFHMNEALGSSNITSEMKGEHSDHCATEAA